jgi:arylsulfatase A-like enzyme
VLGLAYLVALSHLWARVPAGWWTVGLAGGGLLATIAVYTALHRRVELLVALLHRRGGARFWRSCARGAVVAVSAASLLVWSAAWVAGVRTRARARRAGVNVILIDVDTLRKDGVSLLSEHQHERDLTPNLRALLAPRSTVFSRAISQAPWTLPAFASIFTGLYPKEHGAEHITSRLLPEQLTLAEILRDAGYSTMAVVAFHFLTSDLGMTQGFTICDESQSLGPLAITSAEVTDRAIALLAERRHQPFLLFLHYFDPHYVFRDHPEFDFSPDDLALTGLSNLPPALRQRRDRPVGPAEQARVRGYYDEEIAYTDLHIGRLLAFLEESGLRDSTCVIFTADHGEEFFDHGSTGHEKTLFHELVHVPLAIAHPSRAAPAFVREPVETRWLFGTILDLVGVRAPGKAASARSVFTQPGEKAGLVRTSTYPRPPVTDDPSLERVVRLSCVIDSKYKLIKDHTKDRISLFDLENDPAETRDLSADMADRARELRTTLEAWDRELQEATPSRQMPELTDAERQRLKSLGYL